MRKGDSGPNLSLDCNVLAWSDEATPFFFRPSLNEATLSMRRFIIFIVSVLVSMHHGVLFMPSSQADTMTCTLKACSNARSRTADECVKLWQLLQKELTEFG